MRNVSTKFIDKIQTHIETFQKKFIEKIKTQFLPSITFFLNHVFYDITGRSTVQADRPQMKM